MTKEDYIDYWLVTSKKDLSRVEIFFENKDYVFALFCLHLSIEKLCKAVWVRQHKGNFPPRIHNLVSILARTSLVPTDDQVATLEQLNAFQMDGRYPDYKQSIYKYTTKEVAYELKNKAKEIQQWLQDSLQ